MKTALISILYNNPTLLVKQFEYVNRFCLDDFDFIVADNSTDKQAIEGIRHHADRLGCKYIKTNSAHKGGSLSHAYSANTAYGIFKDHYDYFFFMDHDLFALKNFSVTHELGDKVIAGIGQNKSKTYFWPGCVMFKKDEAIDFSCNSEFGLDTGGNLYKMIDKHGLDKCLFFDEQYHENGEFQTSTMYKSYTTINKDMFLHCINGSGWAYVENNEQRLNSLFNILESKTQAA